MEQQNLSEKELKQRRFQLVLPLICIPFLTLMFWIMGGGKTEKVIASQNGGLNVNLPDAKKEDNSLLNKMDFYNQAVKDSLKQLELMRADPNYTGAINSGLPAFGQSPFPSGLNTSIYSGYSPQSSEAKINDRLNQLQTELNKAYTEPAYPEQVLGGYNRFNASTVPAPEVERLQKMMESMDGNSKEEDPEMTQLAGMMDKILDIQHPERVQDRLRKQSEENQGQVYSFKTGNRKTPVTVLDNRSVADYAKEYNESPQMPSNSFYGLGNETDQETEFNAIAAVVQETQTLVTGATIKFRLVNDAFVNGTLIPKGEFIYGIVTLRGERLEVDVQGIQYKSALFPVKLSVYDLDGIAGIKIPGAITRDVVKQNSDQAIQSMSLGSFDQSLGAQAASAGIELGKNLLSKKVKLIKVEVKAGYKVLLKDNKRKDQ